MRKIDIESERQYENAKVEDRSIRAKQSKYYWATAPMIHEFDQGVLEIISGQKVLEIGCSDGGKASLYAPKCLRFQGIDISDEGIRKAQELSLPNATFDTADAHHLPFSDAEFDVVIVNGLLHHLDLKIALSEISRVLKPNGQLCAREPLGTNPLFVLYRAATPKARTPDERPFTLADLRMLSTYFRFKKVRYFGFLSIGSAFIRVPAVRSGLSAIDHVLALTPIKFLFWQFYGIFEKRNAF